MNLASLPIGIVAGMAAALLFAGLVTQSPGAVVLALAAPIPILIASLGWGSRAGFIAAATSAIAIAAFMGTVLAGLTMLLGSALPAALIGHMAGLARPAEGRIDGGGAVALDWYPLPRLLLAIVLLAAASCVALGTIIGYDPAALDAAVAAAVAAQADSSIADPQQVGEFVRLVVAAIPFVQPAFQVLTLVACLYVSVAVVRLSGRLPRPKDDIPAHAGLPKLALPLFAVALALAFLPGLVGTLGAVVTGAFAMAFTLVGLAFIHRRTRGRAARGLLLFTTYAAILLLSFPLFAFLVLGVFDTARNRTADETRT
ncbi:hypothetical protein [Aureimonas sp. ME7]|uniref:hypothetical protein n=1 Tax=Aureimonas sp. ME7 TaxID=2744252 RepID=UPI0015F63B1C|nr:hypothetical protein [Aureimonas sp. ME7]